MNEMTKIQQIYKNFNLEIINLSRGDFCW